MLVARISLTLSRHISLSFIASGRSSGQHPVSSHSCWMYVRASRPAFARPCVGVHKSTSLMSSSLLLQRNFVIYLYCQLIYSVWKQTIQFCISTQFWSIWARDRNLSGVTTPGQSELGAMAMKGYSSFPKLQDHMQDTRWGVLPLHREAVGVF